MAERIKANDLACLLSHKKAIEYARRKGWQSVLIFEDDVELPFDFDKSLNDLMQNTHEFDMLFLHGTMGKFCKPIKYSDWHYRVCEMYGAFAYIVHQRFYDTAINEMEVQQGKLGTDYVYSLLMKKAIVFRAIKPIAFHRPGYSYRAERIEKMYKHLEKK